MRIRVAVVSLFLALSQGVLGDSISNSAKDFDALTGGTWKPNAVFLIAALGGVVAVPNRYQVNTHFDEGDHDLELVSPPGLLLGEGLGLNVRRGEISFGRLDKVNGRVLASGDPIQKFQCHGLDIEVRNTEVAGTHFVIFEKSQDYMTIFDGDDSLWKEILAVYGHSTHATDACPAFAQTGIAT